MATVDIVSGADFSSTLVPDCAEPNACSAEIGDLKATQRLLRESRAREAALLRERETLTRRQAMVTKPFAGPDDAGTLIARLTPRQRTIFSSILEGHANKIIAFDMGISQRTVESHRASIMKKTGAGSLPDLVRLSHKSHCVAVCGNADAAAFLASIVESSDDAIIGKGLDGIVRTWNRAAENVFGYTADEMIGKPITTLFPPERIFEEEMLLKAVCCGKPVGHYETVRLRKDGRPIDVSISVSPIRDRLGTIIGASKIARDITYRKLAREKQLSLDSTTALLRQKGVLLEEMEHRVLNSLQIIGSILMLKAQAVKCEETRSELQDAYNRVISVASVQHHLHDSGREGLVDVSSYIASLCDGLAKSMIDANRPLKLIVKAGGGEVESRNAISLGLIITELVINALKYAFPITHPSDEVLVSYEAEGLGWELVVCDNGVGCPKVKRVSEAKGGLGTRLIAALANNLDAVVVSQTGVNGTRVSIKHATTTPLVNVNAADICHGKVS